VLIDECNGTSLARSNGLVAFGTLAVIFQAGLSGFIEFHDAIHRLTHETRFRYSRALIDQLTTDFIDAQRGRAAAGDKPPG
jgi:predicted nucleic acid-binding protein